MPDSTDNSSIRAERVFPTNNPIEDQRDPFVRDCEYIIFSTAFRRLQGVTQVVAHNGSSQMHNRLTHTLEVSRFAKRITAHLYSLYSSVPSVPPSDKLWEAAWKELKDSLDVIGSHPTDRELYQDRLDEAGYDNEQDNNPKSTLDQETVKSSKDILTGLPSASLPQLADWLDEEVAEAAALIHDMGHPPFGHAGEHVLDELCKSWGNLEGFEGNAQSFRVVTRLAMSDPNYLGLNLSRRVLQASLKYPWYRQIDQTHSTLTKSKGEKRRRKFGAYQSDRFIFERVVEGFEHVTGNGDKNVSKNFELRPLCLEAEIMDYADDVAYSIQDFFDFYRVGAISALDLYQMSAHPDRLIIFLKNIQRDYLPGYEDISKYDKPEDFKNSALFKELQSLLKRMSTIDLKDAGSEAQFSRISEDWAQDFIEKGGVWIRWVKVNKGNSIKFIPRLYINPVSRAKAKFLSQIVRHYIINSDRLLVQQHGYKKIITNLFEVYLDRIRGGEYNILPPRFKRLYEEAQRLMANGVRALAFAEAEQLEEQKGAMISGLIQVVGSFFLELMTKTYIETTAGSKIQSPFFATLSQFVSKALDNIKDEILKDFHEQEARLQENVRNPELEENPIVERIIDRSRKLIEGFYSTSVANLKTTLEGKLYDRLKKIRTQAYIDASGVVRNTKIEFVRTLLVSTVPMIQLFDAGYDDMQDEKDDLACIICEGLKHDFGHLSSDLTRLLDEMGLLANHTSIDIIGQIESAIEAYCKFLPSINIDSEIRKIFDEKLSTLLKNVMANRDNGIKEIDNSSLLYSVGCILRKDSEAGEFYSTIYPLPTVKNDELIQELYIEAFNKLRNAKAKDAQMTFQFDHALIALQAEIRLAVDMVASLTDQQAQMLHLRFTGSATDSSEDLII